jgi:predicted PurR-regulated permease PerM
LILVSEKVFGGIISISSSIFQFLCATIIAGFLLASKQSGELGKKFFRQLVGERGDEYAQVAYQTVSSVTKGVIGVAGIQSAITGLGFVMAGVPFAGLWAFGVLVLCILQIPNTIIVVPIMIYLFTVKSTTVAILWTVYLLLAGLSDNVLKPWLLGMGAPVPMPVIFIGVLGGFIFTGFIGMFTGAIVLSLGYKLFIGWIEAT